MCWIRWSNIQHCVGIKCSVAPPGQPQVGHTCVCYAQLVTDHWFQSLWICSKRVWRAQRVAVGALDNCSGIKYVYWRLIDIKIYQWHHPRQIENHKKPQNFQTDHLNIYNAWIMDKPSHPVGSQAAFLKSEFDWLPPVLVWSDKTVITNQDEFAEGRSLSYASDNFPQIHSSIRKTDLWSQLQILL